MLKISVYNLSKNSLLGQEIMHADSYWRRFRGLLGKKELQFGEGLLLTPCKAVHSIGMRFSLEIIYLDRSNRAVHIMTLKPNRLGPFISNAYQVLELPLGTVSYSKTALGDLFSTRT
ncbi:MAG: DUF192 domain-containing protein [Firmicutes bacterium]|nr:DUF192 domain-containing protein [Bacillota bacterium]